MFYSVRTEPIPTKTCFDVTLKTYGVPSTEHIVTVIIPKMFPFSAPSITLKSEKKLQFKFLRKSQWKPSMGIGEVLIEACHQLSAREMAPRRPVLPPLHPPSASSQKTAPSPQKERSNEKC